MTYARWKRGSFDPALLVRKLEESRQLGSGGRVTFQVDPFFDDAVSVLESGLEFMCALSEADQRSIVSDALWSAAASGSLTATSLVRKINETTRDFVQRPENQYILVSSLSVRHFSGLNRSEVSGHRMYYRRYLHKRFRTGYTEAENLARNHVFGDYPDPGSLSKSYTALWAHTRGRSTAEAADRAFKALDLQRGIWNFALNRREWSRMSGQCRKPVNQVLLGPVHSLHEPDGSLAQTLPWYMHDYVEPIQSQKLKKRWSEVKSDEKGIRRCLARSPYRNWLEDALIRYTQALDSREWEAAFVKLWGLLESLTSISDGENHELVVKRTAFLFSEGERELHLQVLYHLRNYRNRSVHSGEGSEDIEVYLYQLKRYVEQLLTFHLTNAFGFESPKEVAKFLSLPPKASDLQKYVDEQQKTYEKAITAERRANLGLSFRAGK